MRLLWGSVVVAVGLVLGPAAQAQPVEDERRTSPSELGPSESDPLRQTPSAQDEPDTSLPEPAPEPEPAYEPSAEGSWRLPLGYTVAAVGVAGIGAAIGLTVVAKRWDNEAEALREEIQQNSPIQVQDAGCSGPFSAEACVALQDASKKGDDFGFGASLAARLGVPIAVVGALLILTAPDLLGGGVGVMPLAGPGYAGVGLGGRL